MREAALLGVGLGMLATLGLLVAVTDALSLQPPGFRERAARVFALGALALGAYGLERIRRRGWLQRFADTARPRRRRVPVAVEAAALLGSGAVGVQPGAAPERASVQALIEPSRF
ncbi:MAG TPA: hypothetical protein VFQ38_18665 [Longimicrobiales bacterium]|nr:hypothetical protein [Longimicrobiales bacterium]